MGGSLTGGFEPPDTDHKTLFLTIGDDEQREHTGWLTQQTTTTGRNCAFGRCWPHRPTRHPRPTTKDRRTYRSVNSIWLAWIWSTWIWMSWPTWPTATATTNRPPTMPFPKPNVPWQAMPEKANICTPHHWRPKTAAAVNPGIQCLRRPAIRRFPPIVPPTIRQDPRPVEERANDWWHWVWQPLKWLLWVKTKR